MRPALIRAILQAPRGGYTYQPPISTCDDDYEVPADQAFDNYCQEQFGASASELDGYTFASAMQSFSERED
jgi:hypothetical protein